MENPKRVPNIFERGISWHLNDYSGRVCGIPNAKDCEVIQKVKKLLEEEELTVSQAIAILELTRTAIARDFYCRHLDSQLTLD